jgi:hypothetical protein
MAQQHLRGRRAPSARLMGFVPFAPLTPLSGAAPQLTVLPVAARSATDSQRCQAANIVRIGPRGSGAGCWAEPVHAQEYFTTIGSLS